MLKVKTRIAAPLGMALLFVSLTAIPLSFAFHSSGRDSYGSDPAIAAVQPGVNDIIGPWWPFAYVLDRGASLDDRAEPLPAPGCETHIAHNEFPKHNLLADSCDWPSFRSSLDDYETPNRMDDCAKPMDPARGATDIPVAMNHPSRKVRPAKFIAKRHISNSENLSAAVIFARASAREADCGAASLAAARELRECLLKLAILVNDLKFSNDAGIALRMTSSACDDADKTNTTSETVETDTDRQEQPRKLIRVPPPAEEVCYPELLGDPDFNP